MTTCKPAHFLAAEAEGFLYREKSNPHTSNLELLTCGVYQLAAGAASGVIAHPVEESLLFGWEGVIQVVVGDRTAIVEPYDVVYIPRGSTYRLEESANRPAAAVLFRAPAATVHPFYHAAWRDVVANDQRNRRLKGKDVFLMFDIGDRADRLVAGITRFQPRQRSYPPHNHTDQEEIYFFTRGSGAMEVYADEESKTFVHSVSVGDAVTIPLLNYHPVFSHDEELDFIWCIAGERYWVGDKNKAFMNASVASLTA